MRRLKIVLSICSLLLITSLSAQVQVALKLGLDNSTASATGVSDAILPDFHNHTSPSIGIESRYALDKHFSVGSGAFISQRGFDLREGTSIGLRGIDIPIGVELRYREKTISIPLNVQYTYPINKLSLYAKAGGSANVGIGGSYKTVANAIISYTLSDTPISYDNRIQKTVYNAEASLGIGLKYGNGQFLAEVLFSKGLNDKINDDTFDLSLRDKMVSTRVGYAMSF